MSKYVHYPHVLLCAIVVRKTENSPKIRRLSESDVVRFLSEERSFKTDQEYFTYRGISIKKLLVQFILFPTLKYYDIISLWPSEKSEMSSG